MTEAVEKTAIAFDQFKSASRAVTRELDAIRQQIEDTMQRREALADAPLPRKEFADALCAIVDHAADQVPLQFHADVLFKNLLVGNLWNDDAIKRSAKNTAIMHKIFSQMAGGNGGLRNDNLYAWMFRQPLKDLIQTLIERMDYPDSDAGPQSAERREMIASLDIEIKNLQVREAEMIEAARASGMNVALPAPSAH